MTFGRPLSISENLGGLGLEFDRTITETSASENAMLQINHEGEPDTNCFTTTTAYVNPRVSCLDPVN